VITCRVYRDGELERETPFAREVVAEARDGGHRIWVDVVDPTDQELETLRTDLGLHELAVEDSRRWGQRAKVEFYGDRLFLVAHGLNLDERDEVVDREVHLFAAAGLYVVTIRPRFAFDKVDGRLSASRSCRPRDRVPCCTCCGRDGGRLPRHSRAAGGRRRHVEDAVAADPGSRSADADELARRMFPDRRQVARLRRPVRPDARDHRPHPGDPVLATPPLVPYYRDVLDHVIRMLELADNVRDLLGSARELQLPGLEPTQRGHEATVGLGAIISDPR
jgi:magnesium transporter